MTKNIKRFLALILTLVLCVSMVPAPAFAAEVPPDLTSSEVLIEPEHPEISPSSESDSSSSPRGSPEDSDETISSSAEPTVEPTGTPSPTVEPDEAETSGTELPITRSWPTAPRKARAASFGTNGTLYMGDECCPGGVGTPPTLGKHVGTMSVIAMKYGGKYVAGYCIEQARFVP